MPLHASCESKVRNPMSPCVWPKEIFYRNILHNNFYKKKMIDEDHLKLSQIIILQLREETLPWRVTQGNYFYLFLNYSECKKTYSNDLKRSQIPS